MRAPTATPTTSTSPADVRLPAPALAYVSLVLVVAAAAYLFAFTRLPALPPSAWLPSLLFITAFFVLERDAIVLYLGPQRITTALTEVAVLPTLLLAPWPLLVALVPLPRLAMALLTRRAPIKSAFNVAHGILTVGLAGALFAVLAHAGVPGVVAACVATAAYAVGSESIVAYLFARLENASFLATYRRRFLLTSLLSSAYGIPIGLATWGLYSLHPAAVLATLPIFVLLHRYTRLEARSDRELALRRRLAADGQALIGCDRVEVVAERVLQTSHDMLSPGAVRFALAGGRAWGDEPPRWRAVPVVSPVVGRGGARLGTLEVWPRPGRPSYGADDEALLRIVAGQAAHALESVEAITEAARQREAAMRQEKLSALGSLVAGVAHEVNNPLTYLQGNIELALMEVDDLAAAAKEDEDEAATGRVQELQRLLSTALGGASRIGHIVKALRAVARSRSSVDLEDVSLDAVVQNVYDLMRVSLPESVELRVERGPGETRIRGSSPDLHQVVLNLAKNALEATAPKGGVVTLSVGRRDDRVELAVADDGPGIPEHVREKLFTPFFTTKGAAGTGLGLSIVQGIVKEHGGEVRVESSPSGGALFRVVFPLRAGGAW